MFYTPLPRVPHRALLFLILALSPLALQGCADRGIEEHTLDKGVDRLPKDTKLVPNQPEDSSPSTPPAGSTDQLADETKWTVPDGWTLDPTPRRMRLATYIINDESGPVEIAITRFPGDVGGVLANINRWRGQMGQPAVTPETLEEHITRFESGAYKGYETRIDSPQGVMLAAGVFDPSVGATWFIRSTLADAPTADRVQDDLFSMARSIAQHGSDG